MRTAIPRILRTVLLPALASADVLAAQRAAATRQATEQSAPITGIAYTVTFDEATARTRTIKVAMKFTASGSAPVILSLPAWTPGAYEISYFARWVSNFAANADGKAVPWDKVDHDTWRVRPEGARSVTVSFDYRADSLDNAMAWSRRDFAFFNGPNLFLYPEGRGFDFAATVRVETTPQWLVATGMSPVSGAARTYSARNYHDLVDMPFMVGRFDFDSVQVARHWLRLATYPAGSLQGQARSQVWDQLTKMMTASVAIWQEVPFQTYTVMQVADSAYAAASGLEHQNSHLNVITPLAIGNPLLAGLFAHEILHAWNVKRLRPADLWPYQYAHEQPTPWLWVSEGITDYYADLVLVRGGIVDSAGFFAATAGKIGEVNGTRPVSLEDASLSTWVHPVDGTHTIYYGKGSLAGLALDILIRDASDNKRSLDDVMRQLYRESYGRGRGFTGEQWWAAVSAAAGGKSFADFNARYVDGRDPYPWETLLPLAGMRMAVDTIREPRLGVNTVPDSAGVLVVEVQPGSAAAEAGVRPGDYIVAVGDIQVTDQSFGQRFRAAFGARAGAPLPIRVRRGAETLTLNGKVQLAERTEARLLADERANAKAVRIRSGILRGTTGS